MEENKINEAESSKCKCNRVWKYAGIVLATFIGAFLAFYFAVSCTMNHFIHTAYSIHRIQKADRMMMRDFSKTDKEFQKEFRQMPFEHKPIVDFIKTPDSYKFIVDLTPFQGNTNAVNIETEKSLITIKAEATVNKENSETFTKMSQTYRLCSKAKTEKLSKKKVGNRYIITVPIED